MGDHWQDGEFKSDKYAWCPKGFVPLKLTDKMAQPELWRYAQTRREVDAEFTADLEQALRNAGYEPPEATVVRGPVAMAFDAAALDEALRGLDLAREMLHGMRQGPPEAMAERAHCSDCGPGPGKHWPKDCPAFALCVEVEALAPDVFSLSQPLSEPLEGWWGIWREGRGRPDGWVYSVPLTCENATAIAARLNATAARYFGEHRALYLVKRRDFPGQTGDKAEASGPQRSGAGDLVEGERTTEESVQGATRACQGDTTGSYETGGADPAGIPTSGSDPTEWWGVLCTPRHQGMGGPTWRMGEGPPRAPWIASRKEALQKAAEDNADPAFARWYFEAFPFRRGSP